MGGKQLVTLMSRGSRMQPSKLLEDNKTTRSTTAPELSFERNCSQCHTQTALGETATQLNCAQSISREMTVSGMAHAELYNDCDSIPECF